MFERVSLLFVCMIYLNSSVPIQRGGVVKSSVLAAQRDVDLNLNEVKKIIKELSLKGKLDASDAELLGELRILFPHLKNWKIDFNR